MKKIFVLLAVLLAARPVFAETIVVIDSNGTVVQQIVTVPNTVTTTTTTPTTVVTTPTTVVSQPALTVVRQTAEPNTYYYDQDTTGAAIVAGVTSAVVGGLIFDGFHRPHHRAPAPAPAPFVAPRPHR
jgi:hypothetical protein